MGKKTSGKRIGPRHPGRRKLRPGPRPRFNKNNEKHTDKMIKNFRFKKPHIEKMMKNRIRENQSEKMFMAFQGWKKLHQGLKKKMVEGVCSCPACLLEVASRERGAIK